MAAGSRHGAGTGERSYLKQKPGNKMGKAQVFCNLKDSPHSCISSSEVTSTNPPQERHKPWAKYLNAKEYGAAHSKYCPSSSLKGVIVLKF